QAQLRRRVRARPERAAGVDHDGEQTGVRLLPRRADPEPADTHRRVEGTPLLLPAALDVGAAHAAEERPQPFLAGGVGVRRELDALGPIDLLEPLREQLDHRRASLLQPRRLDLDGDAAQAAQRNALLSFSKKDSSWR